MALKELLDYAERHFGGIKPLASHAELLDLKRETPTERAHRRVAVAASTRESVNATFRAAYANKQAALEADAPVAV